jgi:hypothetical protein
MGRRRREEVAGYRRSESLPTYYQAAMPWKLEREAYARRWARAREQYEFDRRLSEVTARARDLCETIRSQIARDLRPKVRRGLPLSALLGVRPPDRMAKLDGA